MRLLMKCEVNQNHLKVCTAMMEILETSSVWAMFIRTVSQDFFAFAVPLCVVGTDLRSVCDFHPCFNVHSSLHSGV